MDIRVAASAVSDGRSVPYEADGIPDPADWAQYQRDRSTMQALPENQVGRAGAVRVPMLRRGITLKRGGAGIVIRGVDQAYVDMITADRTRIVEVLPEAEQSASQVFADPPSAQTNENVAPAVETKGGFLGLGRKGAAK